ESRAHQPSTSARKPPRARIDEGELLCRAAHSSLSPLAIRAFTPVFDGLWRGSGCGGPFNESGLWRGPPHPLPTLPPPRAGKGTVVSRSLGRQRGDFRLVYLFHARLESVLGQSFCKHPPDFWILVRVIDLHSPQPPADPRHWNALRIARRGMLEREITRRRRTRVEVLVEPRVGRHDHRSDLPVVAVRRVAFRPHQGVALAAEHDDMRARSVRVRFLVGADGELRNVARNGAPRHIEPDVTAAGSALLGAYQRKIDGIRDEIRGQQKSL